jgi:hypothetical protein
MDNSAPYDNAYTASYNYVKTLLEEKSPTPPPNAPPTQPQLGRTIKLDPNTQQPYPMTPSGQAVPFTEALKGTISKNPLSELFFSAQNIEAVQQGIRYLVYTQSCNKYVIDRQSEENLRIVMRSIYLQNAKHQSVNVVEQVRELNAIVLRWCVPKIVNEIDSYLQYRNEISKNPTPIERSQNDNVFGTKVLELKQF